MTKLKLKRFVAAGLILCAVPALSAEPLGPEAKAALAEMPEQARAEVQKFEESLHPQSGNVQVLGAHATLNLGDRYYFLPAADAKRVLTEGWGNPPDAVEGVLGMVFPKGRTTYDGSWGAVIQYEDTGHVSDEDAADQDYDQVLAGMKESEKESNEAAREAGYSGATLIGWAQAPAYNAASKTLIWARNIKFDDSEHNTLNYDVRTLARTGVLSINMVDSMEHLPVVKTAAVDLGKTVQLSAGQRYADFDSSTDATAEYGLAGLVAAGAGVAVAKKVGILGIILLFLKKGFIVVLAAAAGAWAWMKRRLGRGEVESAYEGVDYESPSEGIALEDAPIAPQPGDPGKGA